ncbi:EF-hand [Rickenella mellea]|uniref:EF-hand n=1 Tax=Rickenella mellea TaxID=50990 RepID=A0A4Y7Q5P1_9AGAM|nr:EF-hand [Rickenella mellea]
MSYGGYGGGYGGQQQGYSQQQSSYGGGPPPPSQYGSRGPPPGGPGGPGGFAPPQQPMGPPPGADPKLWQWFTSVDTDRSGEINAKELQAALVNGDWTPFDLDTVKMLMTIFDVDRSGTVGFNEFAGLWKYIGDWQNLFRYFDKDRSGLVDGHEFDTALRQLGYQLSPENMRLLQAKYASSPATYGAPQSGGITFDRFVRACVAVKKLSDGFRQLDQQQQRNGWVQLNYESFMNTVLLAP